MALVFSLNEFALAYQKKYLDMATDIKTKTSPIEYGGHSVFVSGSPGCLFCLGFIDIVEAGKFLESDAARKDRDAIYGIPVKDLEGGGPAVVTLNGVIASVRTSKTTRPPGQNGRCAATTTPPRLLPGTAAAAPPAPHSHGQKEPARPPPD